MPDNPEDEGILEPDDSGDRPSDSPDEEHRRLESQRMRFPGTNRRRPESSEGERDRKDAPGFVRRQPKVVPDEDFRHGDGPKHGSSRPTDSGARRADPKQSKPKHADLKAAAGGTQSKPGGRETKDLVGSASKASKFNQQMAPKGAAAKAGKADVRTEAALAATSAAKGDISKKDAAKKVARAAAVTAGDAVVPGAGTAIDKTAKVLMSKPVRQGIMYSIAFCLVLLIGFLLPGTMNNSSNEDVLGSGALATGGDPALSAAAAADAEAKAAVPSQCLIGKPADDSALNATGGGVYTPASIDQSQLAQVSGMKPNQVMHAQEVEAVVKEMGLPDRASLIAQMVAKIESQHYNLANDGKDSRLQQGQDPATLAKSAQSPFSDGLPNQLGLAQHGGDHGSVGIMQQQYPWWGKVDQLLNPRFAARAFLTRLKDVQGWETMDPAVAAQRVQRSGDASGSNYRQQQPFAEALLPKIKNTPPGFNWQRYQNTPSGEGDPKPNVATAPVVSGVSHRIIGPQLEETPPESVLIGPDGKPIRYYTIDDGLGPQPGVQEANQNFNAVRGGRIAAKHFQPSSVGGYRAGDPQDHGKGNASDIMVGDDQAKGDRIAAFFQKHAKALGINYIIWKQRIWQPSAGGEWKQMEDRGSKTQNHMDHVHVSYLPSDKYSGQKVEDISDDSGGDVAPSSPTVSVGPSDVAPSGGGNTTTNPCGAVVPTQRAGSDELVTAS